MGKYLGAGCCKKCGNPAWTCRCFKDARIPRKGKEEVTSENVTKTCAGCKTQTDALTRRFVNGRWYHPGCDAMAYIPEDVDLNADISPAPVSGGPVLYQPATPVVLPPSNSGGPVPVKLCRFCGLMTFYCGPGCWAQAQAEAQTNPDEDPQEWDNIEE